jgi:hypothetical protein
VIHHRTEDTRVGVSLTYVTSRSRGGNPTVQWWLFSETRNSREETREPRGRNAPYPGICCRLPTPRTWRLPGILTDSGAGESWFDPRRGNYNARIGLGQCGRVASKRWITADRERGGRVARCSTRPSDILERTANLRTDVSLPLTVTERRSPAGEASFERSHHRLA